jgi:hypothetical protein
MYLVRKIIARHRFTSAVAALLLVIILGFAYISFYLFIGKNKALRESETYARELTVQTANATELSRLFAFTYFLEAWRQNRGTRAAFVLSFMAKGSKEQKAAMFLFNSITGSEKEEDFRRDFSEDQCWFMEFIIGENYLKNGRSKEALEAFERSYEAAQQLGVGKLGNDGLLVGQIRARIEELGNIENIKEGNEGRREED